MKSFSNGNVGPGCSGCQNDPQSPATLTIDGVRLGGGDTHWGVMI